MKNNSFKLSKIKKILIDKGYRISKSPSSLFKGRLKSFYYTALTSLFLIIFFGLMPSINKSISKFLVNPKIVENNSKLNFEKVLDGKKLDLKKGEIESDKLKVTDLFLDIFEFEIRNLKTYEKDLILVK